MHIKKTKYYQETYSNISNDNFLTTEEGVRITRARISDIPFYPKKKVLDAACGISTLGLTFSNNVYGFDVNPEAIQISRDNGINVKRGDVNKKWDYSDGFFDIVIVSHIIEHVDNTDHLILEAKRVLKKNGLIIVITPNLAAWFNRIFLICGMQPYFSEVSTVDKTLGMKFLRRLNIHVSPMGHLRMFTGAAAKDIVKLHGFKIIKTAGLEFTVFPKPLLLIDRLFAKKYSLASNVIVVGRKK